MEAGTQVRTGGRWSALQAISETTGWAPLLVLTGLATAEGFDSNGLGVFAPEIRHTFHLDHTAIDSLTEEVAA